MLQKCTAHTWQKDSTPAQVPQHAEQSRLALLKKELQQTTHVTLYSFILLIFSKKASNTNICDFDGLQSQILSPFPQGPISTVTLQKQALRKVGKASAQRSTFDCDDVPEGDLTQCKKSTSRTTLLCDAIQGVHNP